MDTNIYCDYNYNCKCKCHGHNLDGDICLCICSCNKDCKKFCRKRDYDKIENLNIKDKEIVKFRQYKKERDELIKNSNNPNNYKNNKENNLNDKYNKYKDLSYYQNMDLEERLQLYKLEEIDLFDSLNRKSNYDDKLHNLQIKYYGYYEV